MIENGLNFIESYLPGVPGITPYGIAGAAANNAFGPNSAFDLGIGGASTAITNSAGLGN